MANRGAASATDGAAGGPDHAGAPRYPRALYRLEDVEDALGQRDPTATADDGYEGEHDDVEPRPPLRNDTEYQARVGAILGRGEAGRWRVALGPAPGVVDGLDALARRAPHLEAVSDLVRRHLRAAANIGTPVSLPRVLLLGGAGTGKTWYLGRLGRLLGVPFRSYPMNASSLSEGLQGAHPSWRNSQPGLIATTLLHEAAANPLILVDEFDKAQSHGHNADPYRPFYTLLEPAGATDFRDEYLQFPMDASAVMFVMSANDLGGIPAPILDRLTVLEVPEIGRGHLAAVAESVYIDANAARVGYFDPEPTPAVLEALLLIGNPRGIRLAIEDAMVRAASEGRRTLDPGDIRDPRRPARHRIGFHA